jgi:hypothetical protein
VKHPTTRQLVRWAGAAEDWYEIHYDKDFALSKNMPGVIVHGRLKAAFLSQLMTDWIGDRGVVKKISCSYRGVDIPGIDLVCKGKVTNKYVKDDEKFVECEIWVENSEGKKNTPGTALVTLPSKEKVRR